jgi:hypothetical protein
MHTPWTISRMYICVIIEYVVSCVLRLNSPSCLEQWVGQCANEKMPCLTVPTQVIRGLAYPDSTDVALCLVQPRTWPFRSKSGVCPDCRHNHGITRWPGPGKFMIGISGDKSTKQLGVVFLAIPSTCLANLSSCSWTLILLPFLIISSLEISNYFKMAGLSPQMYGHATLSALCATVKFGS